MSKILIGGGTSSFPFFRVLFGALVPLFLLVLSACSSPASSSTVAVVKPVKPNVSFNSQGGSAVASVKLDEVKAVQEPANPTKDGVVFVGWNKEATGAGTVWDFSMAVTEDMTLYARWAESAKAATVIFNHNYESSTGIPTTTKSVEKEFVTTAPVLPTRVGFFVIVWNTKADGSGLKWDFSTPFKGDLTLYAQWLADLKKVTFNHGYGTTPKISEKFVKTGDVTSAPTLTPRAGFRSLNYWRTKADRTGRVWNFKTDKVTKDMTLYAVWFADLKTVVFNHNYRDDKTKPALVTIKNLPSGSAIDPPTISRPQWKIASWNDKSDGTGKNWFFALDRLSAKIAKMTLYAQWIEDTRTVTYDYNSATDNGSGVSGIVPYGTPIPKPTKIPVRAGKVFGGWLLSQTKGDNTSYYYWNYKQNLTFNVTLIAEWIDEGQTKDVTFNMNHGEINETILRKIKNGTVMSNFTSSPAIRPRYRFIGWNTKADGSGDTWDIATKVVSTDATLYAQWEALKWWEQS